ncbi:MAG: zf-HC2 domain-containing protein [Oligoflexia bacterium]|nr:zf-HC2 domain-containing protein [Oligoflexia bacterium]
MKHEKIRKKIGAYIDNELNESVKKEVINHLVSCAECRVEAEGIRNLDSMIRATGTAACPPEFTAKLNEKIGQKAEKTRVFSLLKFLPVPVALAVLVLFVSVFFAAAPFIYASENDGMKTEALDMAVKMIAACYAGSAFSPAAFAKFCGACSENMCSCCGEAGVEQKCRNKGVKNGNKE